MGTNESGYGILEECLSTEECERLVRAVSNGSVSRSRGGARHMLASPVVFALAKDDRLMRIAGAWLGCAPIPFRATLFDKSSTTNWLIPWHQDTALPLVERFDLDGWGPWSQKLGVNYSDAPAWALARVIALRVHLDDSTPDNGPLRVIPGSHLAGVLSDQAVAAAASVNDPAECCVPRGGIIAMRPLIIHSSSKARNDEPRRVLHIEYSDSLDLAAGIRLAVV